MARRGSTAWKQRLGHYLVVSVWLVQSPQSCPTALAWTHSHVPSAGRATTGPQQGARPGTLPTKPPSLAPHPVRSCYRGPRTAPSCTTLRLSEGGNSGARRGFYRFQPSSSVPASSPPPVTPVATTRMTRTIPLDDDNGANSSSRSSTKQARIVSRCVQVSHNLSITVWEWERPAAVVETYWQVQQQGLALTRQAKAQRNRTRSDASPPSPPTDTGSTTTSNDSPPSSSEPQILDPFGLVTWPGSVVAVQELLLQQNELLPPRLSLLRDRTVLVLGAGVGVEAQAAAQLGARRVVATDVHPTTLRLLEYGARMAGLTNRVETQLLDIALHEQHPLPDCDVMIVADVLYNDALADHVIRRCVEARRRPIPPLVLISDSQRFVGTFEGKLNEALRQEVDPQGPKVAWMSRRLHQFTGSGVCIDADQTYDVKARVMWIGLTDYVQRLQQEQVAREAGFDQTEAMEEDRETFLEDTDR